MSADTSIPWLATRTSRWPKPGGWSFPVAPNLDASQQPAIWRPSEAPSIIIFRDGLRGAQAITSRATAAGLDISNEATNHEGRHMIFEGNCRHYRILIKPARVGFESGFIVQHDPWLYARISAIRDFCKALDGAEILRPTRPTNYQCRRLELLLAILDNQFLSDGRRRTLRQLAQTSVYPRADLGRAIEWKSSSERRYTQRLVSEANHLMRQGYRALLRR